MLAGTPVIASAAGGALEIVDAGRTGLLVPPGDPGALKQSLLQLLASSEQAEGLAREGGREARILFNRTKMIAGVSEIVEFVSDSTRR